MNHADLLDFDKAGGLVTAMAQDAETGEILMLAHMNRQAFERSLETGEVVYWSRSRNKLWHKGEESGNVQRIREILIDCDGDALLCFAEKHNTIRLAQYSLRLEPQGLSSHTGLDLAG